jgi:tetratricopeptide (TPR) repeat protein
MSYRLRYAFELIPGRVWLAAAVSVLCLLVPSSMVAQEVHLGPPTQGIDQAKTMELVQGGSILVTVFTDDKRRLDRQSVVKLYSEAHRTTSWQTTTDRSETIFGGLSPGMYDVEVSALGYVSSRKEVEVVNLVDTLPVEIALGRDPLATDLDSADTLMSPQAGKEMKHAIKALKAGNLKEAQKRLEATGKLAPSSEQLKFLLGYLFFQKKDFEQAQTYLTQATALNPHYGQALALLGRVQLLRGQYEQAATTLEQAVAADPDNWMAHNLLAGTYLERHEYEKAREHAQLAIDKGRRDATVAQLVLGEALANLGRVPEGIEALKAFLVFQPKSTAVPHARELLSQLEQHPTTATPGASATLSETVSFTVVNDALLSANSKLPDTAWQPPGIDRATPPVAAGVTCPSEKVIDEAGARVEQFVDDVAKFAAIEDLLHERLDEMGNPTAKETRKFDYAASISQARPGVVLVEEFRTERYGLDTLPDQFADRGFAAMALVFHPAMRDSFKMTCEGLGDWHGQATWLVHFRQREDRANHIQGYVAGALHYPVSLKGRAWITADKFQIVRIESEMVSPLPEIQLLAEHQITEYGPVPFPKKNIELWLPKSAEVYMHFRGRRYYRKHSFGKYMLFSVDEEHKILETKHDSTGPGSTSPRKHRWWPG